MPYIHKIGDILTTNLSAIGHGVNLHGVMGSGIAKVFRQEYPEIFPPYKQACNNGTLTVGGVLPVQVLSVPNRWIYNMASQDMPGANARMEWLIASTVEAIRIAKESGLTGIALPRIGAGIGGLQWDEVRVFLERVGDAEKDFVVEIWSLPGA